MSGVLLPLLTSAQAPITTSMLLFGAGDTDGAFDYIASVIASDSKGGETLFVTCTPVSTTTNTATSAMPTSTDDDDDNDDDADDDGAEDCGFGPGLTITLGTAAPTSAYDVYLAEPTEFSLSAHCDVATAASTAVCTQIAGGAEANDPGTSIWTAKVLGLGAVAATTDLSSYDDITFFPVTITAGMDKLAASGAAITTSSTSPASSSVAAAAAGSSSASSARPSSSAVATSAKATGTTGAVVLGAATSSARSITSVATGSAITSATSAAASASSVAPNTNNAAGLVERSRILVVLYGAFAVCSIATLSV